MLSSFCKQNVYMILQSFLNYFTNAIIVLVGDDMNRIMIYKKGDSLFANFYDEYEEKYHKLGNDDVLNNDEDIGWLDYRNSSYAGDPNYVENVSRYYNGDVQKLNVR